MTRWPRRGRLPGVARRQTHFRTAFGDVPLPPRPARRERVRVEERPDSTVVRWAWLGRQAVPLAAFAGL